MNDEQPSGAEPVERQLSRDERFEIQKLKERFEVMMRFLGLVLFGFGVLTLGVVYYIVSELDGDLQKNYALVGLLVIGCLYLVAGIFAFQNRVSVARVTIVFCFVSILLNGFTLLSGLQSTSGAITSIVVATLLICLAMSILGTVKRLGQLGVGVGR